METITTKHEYLNELRRYVNPDYYANQLEFVLMAINGVNDMFIEHDGLFAEEHTQIIQTLLEHYNVLRTLSLVLYPDDAELATS